MIAKTVEIRDRATFIPALAIQLTPGSEADRYLLARSGYGREVEKQGKYVLLMRLAGGDGKYSYDSETWSNRTMTVAHRYLTEHFDDFVSGAVVDVEYLLGQRQRPRDSEQVEAASA